MKSQQTDHYFGLCPYCRNTDGYINIGKGHWFFCKEHKVKWWVGSNLFSGWEEQTEKEQEDIHEELGFGNYQMLSLGEVIFPDD